MTKGRPSRAAKKSAEEKIREFVLPNALTDSESDDDTFTLPSKKQPDHKSSTNRTESSSQKLKKKDNGNNGSLSDKDDSDGSDGSIVDPQKKQMEAKTIGSKGKRPAKGAISIGAGQKRIRKEQDSEKGMGYRENEDDDGEDEYESDEEEDISDDDDDIEESDKESSKGKARQTKKRKGDDDADESGEDMQPLKKVRMEALLRGTYTHGHRKTPLLPLLQSMAMQETRRSRMLALTVLDGVRDDETYRWPVREALLPAVPKSPYVNASAPPNHFELQGMGFVEELTGVPKKEEDYSDSDQEEGDEEEYDSALEEELLNRRRQEKRELKKQRRQRHEDEHSANERLEQVQQFMKDEITAFAQNQYRKGTSHRIKDLYSLQRRTMPDSQIRAVRSMIGGSNTGEEQLDELTPIQENATRFAAEDSLRSILDRLPYVIRQGALGRMPEYAELGLPKPAMAHYERGWDTIMASASLAGVDDRILKKVGLRMKLLLSQSRQSRYYEPPPEAKFATGHT